MAAFLVDVDTGNGVLDRVEATRGCANDPTPKPVDVVPGGRIALRAGRYRASRQDKRSG
jgi:hypothetical protein